VGLNELMEITGLCPGAVDAESISMVLAPCLNASGRIAHAFTSYKLLVTDSREEAYHLAIDMKQENAERRRLTGEIVSTAREQVLDTGIDVPLLMVGGENYHPGVIGLVASRLVDEFHRPAIALNIGAEMSQGSSRSIPEFDIISALGECRDILSRFGGHPMAAGFTIATADVERLRRCLLEKASRQLAGFDFSSCLPIDAEVQLSSLGGETFSTIQRFAPFGVGNQIPALLSRGVRVTDCRSAGNGGRHLRLKLRDDDITWDGIGFGLGEYIEQVTPNIDIVYRLGVDDWGGKRLLQLDILDFAPSE
jgi:single-stranded-DNA-specific exonuclease